MNAPEDGRSGEAIPLHVEVEGLPRDADAGGELAEPNFGICDVFAESSHVPACMTPARLHVNGVVSPRGCVGTGESADDNGAMADTPQNWLPYFIQKAGLNPNKLATLSGENRQTIYKLSRREGRLSEEWATKLAPHLGATPVDLVFGPGAGAETMSRPASMPSVGIAPVRGQTAAGVWLAEDHVDATVYDPIPVVLARYPDLPQFAYKVLGPSMDQLRIFDGDYVIAVDYWQARSSFQTKDVVVVERRQGRLVERTCKEVAAFRDRVELWPRSSHPNFQEPIVVPLNRQAQDDGVEIEVVGLVIGRHTPM